MPTRSPLKLIYSKKLEISNDKTERFVNAFGLCRLKSLPLSSLTTDQKIALIRVTQPRLAAALVGLVDDLVLRTG